MSLNRYSMKAKKPLLNHDELLKNIERDRELLGAYFQDIATKNSKDPSPMAASATATSKTTNQRDSYDLFFESACISIKSLPPKLAAEAKSRISQIITEFELRAISEQEAQEQNEKRQMARSKRVKHDQIEDPSSGIFYEFKAFT